MSDQTNPSPSQNPGQPASPGTDQTLAVLALVCGVISLCGIVVALIGIPFGLLGLVLGYFGRRDQARKNLATIGMVLGGIGILLSCFPIFIAVMRLLGPKVGTTFSSINSSLP